MTAPITELRALCAELLEALQSWSPHGGGPLEYWESEEEALLMARAENALAQPEPVAPTPIPMAERLPCLEDCDEQGWCWLWERDCGCNGRKWSLVDRAWSLSQSDEDLPIYTHWLPANALPTPEATVHD